MVAFQSLQTSYFTQRNFLQVNVLLWNHLLNFSSMYVYILSLAIQNLSASRDSVIFHFFFHYASYHYHNHHTQHSNHYSRGYRQTLNSLVSENFLQLKLQLFVIATGHSQTPEKSPNIMLLCTREADEKNLNKQTNEQTNTS